MAHKLFLLLGCYPQSENTKGEPMIKKRKTRPVIRAGRRTAMIRRSNSTRYRGKQRLLSYRLPSARAGGGNGNLKVHPAADSLPELPATEYAKLKAAIRSEER